jgi:hypothetical protein
MMQKFCCLIWRELEQCSNSGVGNARPITYTVVSTSYIVRGSQSFDITDESILNFTFYNLNC